MNPLIFVILIVMILFTVYHFWTDIRNAWNTGETFAEGMTSGQIGKKVTYELLTDKDAYCGDGSSKTTKMIWTGEVCEGGKIKWNSMKSLAGTTRAGQENGCAWKRESNNAEWQTKYLGGCGTAATFLPLPTTLDELKNKGGFINGEKRDPMNDKQYACKDMNGNSAGTFATFNADTLTAAQKAKAAELYPGKPASYYAAVQGTTGDVIERNSGGAGCTATGDGVMKSVIEPSAPAAASSASIILGQPVNNASVSASPIENTVTTTDDQGNTVTTSTTESSSVDPTTGAKIEKKCISISQLANAGAWVDHLFGALANTKCADKNKIEAAKSASKLDFISGAIAPSNSNDHYMKAINKAKPFLEQAFANSQNSLAQGGADTIPGNNNNLAQGTTESISNNTAQTQAPVSNNIQAPQPPTWQAQQMAQQFQQQQQQQQQQPQILNGQVLPNGFVVQPGNGKCPNGCKYPQYDNKGCEDTVLNGKSYRKCPWVKDGLNGGDCAECGAILMPKNEFGYARTRPGLFDHTSVNMAMENAKSSNKGDYYNIGKNFMNQLSKIKNFRLPETIDTNEYVSIGKMVHKYQTEETDSSKDLLTKFINEILTTSNISNNNKIQNNSLISEQVNSMGGNFDIDQKKLTMKGAYAYDEGKKEVATDNRLGGSSSMYEKHISEKIRRRNGIPRDPRKKPNPYDSVWDIFKY